jgi:hypothetical protein
MDDDGEAQMDDDRGQGHRVAGLWRASRDAGARQRKAGGKGRRASSRAGIIDGQTSHAKWTDTKHGMIHSVSAQARFIYNMIGCWSRPCLASLSLF